MSKIYQFSISVDFEVSDKDAASFCHPEAEQVCDGDCGGECSQYFYARMHKYMKPDMTPEEYKQESTNEIVTCSINYEKEESLLIPHDGTGWSVE